VLPILEMVVTSVFGNQSMRAKLFLLVDVLNLSFNSERLPFTTA
jgi:hypothetical protein